MVIFSQYFLILLRIFNCFCAIFVFNFAKVCFHFVSTTLTVFNRRFRCVFRCFMLTNRLLTFIVVCNFNVDSLSITVYHFELIRIRGLRARPRAGVCAGGKCDAEAGRDPQRIRHIVPINHLCDCRWWWWGWWCLIFREALNAQFVSVDARLAIFIIKECTALRYYSLLDPGMNCTGSKSLPCGHLKHNLALLAWALASLMGANYDAASCFCEGGIGLFCVFVLQSHTLTLSALSDFKSGSQSVLGWCQLQWGLLACTQACVSLRNKWITFYISKGIFTQFSCSKSRHNAASVLFLPQ